MPWKPIIEVVTACFSVVSGVCWIISARIKIPILFGVLDSGSKSDGDKIRSQSQWNAIAAWFAGGAALSQAASVMIDSPLWLWFHLPS